jgi:hypothetical protein
MRRKVKPLWIRDPVKLNIINSERQLKRKISDWKLDKKVKGHEMKSIVRKQARLKLKGKIAAFTIRGQPVPQHKIVRWEKTPGNCQVDEIAQQLADSRKLEIP